MIEHAGINAIEMIGFKQWGTDIDVSPTKSRSGLSSDIRGLKINLHVVSIVPGMHPTKAVVDAYWLSLAQVEASLTSNGRYMSITVGKGRRDTPK